MPQIEAPKVADKGTVSAKLTTVVDYKLVTATAPFPLAQTTREWIREGWQPLGPAQFFPNGEWTQTLVKYGLEN